MDYITTGEMAKYCGVTKRTLWLYHEKGLLSPKKIDGATGYYYYAPAQRWQLDRILHLKALGLSLEEIGQLLSAATPSEEAQLLRTHIGRLEAERERIQTALFGTRLLLAPVALKQHNVQTAPVRLEHMTPCKYLRLDAACNTDDTYFDPTDSWIDQLHKLRLYLEKEKIPLSAYYIGHIYKETEPGCHELTCSAVTAYIDAAFAHGETSFIPGGHYMTLTFPDRCDQADNKARQAAYDAITQEARLRGYTIAGDAFDEQLLVNADYAMYVRMMVPVQVPSGTYLGL